ncbi:FHA domain-containing protein, partial [Candidatus Sumerlaeota bacterium]|nr:FHA domain-containing protein [Candidatus Sumerlaeota bacterium]
MEQTVPCRLVIESEENRGMVFPLRERTISIGRGPQNNIQIIDTRMSRVHARLDREKEGWVIRNLQSKNGIMINSKPVRESTRLSPGDQIHIGNTIFTFEPDVVPVTEDRTGTDSAIKWLDDDQSELETSQIMEIPAEDAEKEISDVQSVPAGGEERLRSIYKIGKIIQSILNLDDLLDKVMAITCQVLHPTHACIMLYDKKNKVLVPKAVQRPAGASTEIMISGSIIHQAMEDRVAVLMSDGQKDERFKKSDSVVMHQIHSAICAPLISKDEVLGALYADTRGPLKHFSDADLQWAAGVASQAALAIAISLLHAENIAKHEQEKEMQIARDIQMNLLPRSMPRVQG